MKTVRANGEAKKNIIMPIGGEVPTNGAKSTIEFSEPYTVEAIIKGTSDLLFHRWNCEEIDIKAGSAKGSKAKKTDNIESYLWREESGVLCLPGEYIRQSIIHAAKFKQDPRSPRKSAMDLFKAGVVVDSILCSLGRKVQDYDDRRRVVIQRNGVNRTRPAFKAGWSTTVRLMVLLPEYIRSEYLNEVLQNAGRLVGVGDFRPTYGRFQVTKFKVLPNN